MAKLFLSYSREDTGQVRPIAACLERAGHEVWWDQHISGGEQFADAIEKALHDADVIVAIWSEAAARSAWVRDEAAAGRDSGRLVPVTIDGSPPPLGFRQYQTIDLSKGKVNARSLAPLEQAIAAKASGPAQPAAHARPRKPAIVSSGRWAAAAVALVLVIAGGLFFSGTLGWGASGGLSAKVKLGQFQVISGVPGEVSQALNEELLAAFGSENLVSVVTADASAPFVLDGSVRKLDDALRFTVQFEECRDRRGGVDQRLRPARRRYAGAAPGRGGGEPGGPLRAVGRLVLSAQDAGPGALALPAVLRRLLGRSGRGRADIGSGSASHRRSPRFLLRLVGAGARRGAAQPVGKLGRSRGAAHGSVGGGRTRRQPRCPQSRRLYGDGRAVAAQQVRRARGIAQESDRRAPHRMRMRAAILRRFPHFRRADGGSGRAIRTRPGDDPAGPVQQRPPGARASRRRPPRRSRADHHRDDADVAGRGDVAVAQGQVRLLDRPLR
ncbi:MAG: TIR domain-containing protein [Sphingomonas sp.]|nr:TIR domain-containing protein [Sphingomonas sp.]